MKKAAILAVILLPFWFWACGGDNGKPPAIDQSVTGGTSPIGTGGINGEGGEVQSIYAPQVTITAPVGGDEPTEANIVGTEDFDVRCTAVQSAEPASLEVDEGSVKIAVVDEEGTVLQELPASPTTTSNEYTATVTLPADTANGPLTLRCSAADLGSPPNVGTDTTQIFVDGGPSIEVLGPEANSAHALEDPVTISFRVEAWELAAGDEGAAVDTIELTVNNVAFEATEGEPGTYSATINFADATLFPETPTGSMPVVITATNARGVARVEHFTFIVDGEGPTVAISAPGPNSIVAREVTLAFTVTDALSGVDPDTLVVVINGSSFQYDPTGDWSKVGDTYSFSFDASALDAQWMVTVNIAVDDLVGNSAQQESYFFYLDYEGPLASLDPPPMRDVSSPGLRCSDSYDPVGDLALNDGDVIDATVVEGNFIRVRAMVWDVKNDATDARPAGIDKGKVYLYLQPNGAAGIVEDTDGDGACDEVVSSIEDATTANLKPLTPGGSGNYGITSDYSTVPIAVGCQDIDDPVTATRMCLGEASDLFRVVQQAIPGRTADEAIYAVGNAILPGTATCTGERWELTPDLLGQQEGWMCLAVRAVDTVGNVGLSRPLRFCLDHPLIAGTPDCSAASMPSCRVDDCSPPPEMPAMIFDVN